MGRMRTLGYASTIAWSIFIADTVRDNDVGCYQTQIDKGIVNLDWVKNVAGVNGLTYNKKYAEAFAINHMFRNKEDV